MGGEPALHSPGVPCRGVDPHRACPCNPEGFFPSLPHPKSPNSSTFVPSPDPLCKHRVGIVQLGSHGVRDRGVDQLKCIPGGAAHLAGDVLWHKLQCRVGWGTAHPSTGMDGRCEQRVSMPRGTAMITLWAAPFTFNPSQTRTPALCRVRVAFRAGPYPINLWRGVVLQWGLATEYKPTSVAAVLGARAESTRGRPPNVQVPLT